MQQLQKAQQQNSNHHNTSLPPSNGQTQVTIPSTQTTPPNNTSGHMNQLPASLLTPSTPGSGGLTPQHLKTPSRLLEPSPEETTDLEELEQFAKTFKQRRIKLGKYLSFYFTIRYLPIKFVDIFFSEFGNTENNKCIAILHTIIIPYSSRLPIECCTGIFLSNYVLVPSIENVSRHLE